MKQLTLINIAIAALATTAMTACSHKSATDHDHGLPVIDVATPLTDSITVYNTYPGYLYANATADVMGRVDGIILSRPYNQGDLVQKGAVLFTIESTKYLDQVKSAKAALATAKSNYEYASARYAAMKKALESDAVSQMDVTQAQSNMEQAEASIHSAEAQLSAANTNLGYCTVRAPFTGHVSASTLDPGAYVSGGASPVKLATIYDDQTYMYVVLSIGDSEYERLMGTKGTDAEEIYRHIPVTFNEQLDHEYNGKLIYTDPAVDKSTGTIAMKVELTNTYGELKPGMYATVHMPAVTESRAILIRDSSIGTDQLGKYIYIVNDSDKVVYTPIKVGDLYNDTLRIVNEGLAANQRYVTSALLKVRNGMQVKPVTVK